MKGFRRKCGINYLTATVDETVTETTSFFGGGTASESIVYVKRGDLPVYWSRVSAILLGDSSYYEVKDYKSKNKTGF